MNAVLSPNSAADCAHRLPPRSLRAPTDVETANRLFGANCGPVTFAALLSLQTCDVMQFFSHFETRKFTTCRDMMQALKACGIEFAIGADYPEFGFALIQIEGPWTQSRKAARWSDKYTHWVGVCGRRIYDINAAAWMPAHEWEAQFVSALIAATPGATGWSVKRSVQVPAQAFFAEQAVPGLCFS